MLNSQVILKIMTGPDELYKHNFLTHLFMSLQVAEAGERLLTELAGVGVVLIDPYGVGYLVGRHVGGTGGVGGTHLPQGALPGIVRVWRGGVGGSRTVALVLPRVLLTI